MRHKDDQKHQAICDAAIRLITANGFADTSMSKIAREAGVSPATIYVYFENKEDLLNKVYLQAKRQMSAELLVGITPETSILEAFRVVWLNFYRYAMDNAVQFAFTEQFANSPLVEGFCKEESMEYFKPLIALFMRGQQEKVFKDIPLEIFFAFTFGPLTSLIKEHVNGAIVFDEKALELTYEIALDAISV